LDQSGARLVLAGRSEKRLAAVGVAGPVVTGDVTDPQFGKAVVTTAVKEFGRLDGVVNATGVVAFGSLTDTSDEIVERLFRVNALGALWLARASIPALAQSQGFLVHISGIIADMPMPGLVAYSASKAALAAATTALVKEVRAQKVQVLDARPPHTNTDLVHHALAGSPPPLPAGADPDRVAARIVRGIQDGDRLLPAAAFDG
jgi:cyclic-di-GMP-binding biofilm dispersal mediator protein